MTSPETEHLDGHLEKVKRQLLWRGMVAVLILVMTNGATISYGIWVGGRWVEAVEQRQVQDRADIDGLQVELQRRQEVVDQFNILQGEVRADRAHFIQTLMELREEVRALRRERNGG